MLFNNKFYSNGNIVININAYNFGGLLKMGDLIAVLNIIEHIRIANNNQNIKFYIPDTALQNRKYVKQFKEFVSNHCDYISNDVGNYEYDGKDIEIWGVGKINGHVININKNLPELKKKICIFPLIDAEYNYERNWTNELLQRIIDEYTNPNYNTYEKIICIKNKIDKSINVYDFLVSNNFETNLNHLLECEYFVGGDTGTSHFVGALNNNEQKLTFYYNNGNHGIWESSFTTPFYSNKPNVKIIYYNK
jgi:hypothetical protein